LEQFIRISGDEIGPHPAEARIRNALYAQKEFVIGKEKEKEG
jgi:hypothetical protein